MSMSKMAKKRLIIISITIVLLAACLAGLWFFIQYRNDQKTVEVVPVSQIADYYWPEQDSSSGMVVSSYVQEIYPDSSKVISEIFVQEGQEVNVGDPILQYDKTKLELDVEAKQLALQEIDLKIETAQKQLTKLRNTKAASTSKPTTQPTPTKAPTVTPKPGATTNTTPTPTPTPTPVPPGTATVYSRLDLTSEPYEGSGTSDDPYVFLCTSDCVITSEFWEWLFGQGTVEEATPTPEPTEGPEEDSELESDVESLPEDEATSTPSLSPTPRPSELVSPFAAVFEVRDGDSEYGQLISSFRLDGTELSGGFQLSGSVPGYSTLDSIAALFGASPSPSADNYNDMGYTTSELRELISEKKQEITDLQHSRKQAQLDLDKATLLLRNSTVLSSVDGVVKSLTDLDTAAAEGNPFMVISGDNTYYVTGAISESLLGLVETGDQVTVMDYTSGNSYTAQIVSIADYPLDEDSGLYYYGSGNPNSSSYEFTAVVDGGEGLQNGAYVDITLNAADEEAADALYIQKAYIREDDGGSYVMKAGIDNRLIKQYVQTGKTLYGSSLEIRSGLTIDDYVAFPYGSDVKDGVRVTGTENDAEGDVSLA